MMSDLRDKAITLANRPYRVVVFLDKTTEGDSIYVALNPELEGCVSQGDTPEEAIGNLKMAREDFIYFLLEDELDVPEPQYLSSNTILTISEDMPSDNQSIENKLHYA
ncbi:MAG: type II toxin-antitoxin system HicB family antitoxin [Anaerolineaceae bacterium]|nr:type II toxin-antitoxin system HicB family antitoxin [Anaerolineaceae bacterium]